MSDPIARFERLAARARQALPREETSVAPEVLRRVRAVQPEADRPLWWFALGSAVAAACVLAVSGSTLLAGSESATELALYAGWMMM